MKITLKNYLPKKGIFLDLDENLVNDIMSWFMDNDFKWTGDTVTKNIAWYASGYVCYIKKFSSNPALNVHDIFYIEEEDGTMQKSKKSKKVKSQYLIFN